MPRLWCSINAPKILACPRCGESFTPNSPRQKFCTPLCQGREADTRRPPKMYGTPEYYERKKAEISDDDIPF